MKASNNSTLLYENEIFFLKNELGIEIRKAPENITRAEWVRIKDEVESYITENREKTIFNCIAYRIADRTFGDCEFDELSKEFFEYISNAAQKRAFSEESVQEYFQRGLNVNAYRAQYDVVESLLGEIYWEIQGMNDDYLGAMVEKITELFVDNGLNPFALDGLLMNSVFDGLRISTNTTHIYGAVKKLMSLEIPDTVIQSAISSFESEIADLYSPFDRPLEAHRMEHALELIKAYEKS